MPENFIAGTWVAAHVGGRREIRCPADGELVAEIDESTAVDTEAAIAAARAAFDEGEWSRTSARERGDLLLRVADLLQRDKAEMARMESLDTGKRLRRERDRHRRRDQRLPPLRSGGRRRGRTRRRHRQPRRGQPDRARAGRSLRADHPVELPAAPGLLEGRPGTGSRLHVRAQAERALPAHRDPPDAPARRGRAARRRRQPRARRRAERRRPAQRGPACRPRLLHRRARHRQADHGDGFGHGEEDRARARRQEPQHRLRRRRPRDRARHGDDRGVPALRPGVLGRCPAGGRGVHRRGVRRRARRACARHPARRSLRREGRDRGADLAAPPRQGHGVRRGRGRRGRRGPGRRQAGHRGRAGQRLLLRADRARRRTQRDERRAGRVVRPGAHRRDLHRRGRRGSDRQRLDLRPGRRGLDPGRRQGPARRGPDADGHGLDQRLPPVRRPGGVGRIQAVRHRPRARAVRASRSTRRPSTSGTTSRPVPSGWFGSSTSEQGGAAREQSQAGPLGLRHRGWRVRRLCDRQPDQRRPVDERARARGGSF